MLEVKFYDYGEVDDALLKFAVIISQSKGKWVLCKHRERDTYEVPGGHREDGEEIEELSYHMNDFIVKNGFVNLDFMGNLGHSIVKAKGDRIYIEKGNTAKLGDVKYFTFEPHIAFLDSKYGYKKENIYYFAGDRLVEL